MSDAVTQCATIIAAIGAKNATIGTVKIGGATVMVAVRSAADVTIQATQHPAQ